MIVPGLLPGDLDRLDQVLQGPCRGRIRLRQRYSPGPLNAGTTKTLTIDLAPGHYAFVCNLPGHYGQGMHTDFTVT